jgi:hypothetical protein
MLYGKELFGDDGQLFSVYDNPMVDLLIDDWLIDIQEEDCR